MGLVDSKPLSLMHPNSPSAPYISFPETFARNVGSGKAASAGLFNNSPRKRSFILYTENGTKSPANIALGPL